MTVRLSLILALSTLALAEEEKECNGAEGGVCELQKGVIHPENLSPYASYINENPRDTNKPEQPMSAKFINLLGESVSKFWDNGTPSGKYQGKIQTGESSHGTYSTHVFFFRDNKGREVGRYTMRLDEPMYIIHDNRPEILNSETYRNLLKDRQFLIDYKNRTGQPWLSVYPRNKPHLHIWPAPFIGHTHTVKSSYGHWNGEAFNSDGFDAKIVTLATQPKVFLIENLISEAECDHIIDLARNRIAQSFIGNSGDAFKDETRTSRTGWIERTESDLLNHIFKRFADVLHMEDHQLNHNMNAEPLQVVHYNTNQHYYNHFDFFYTGTNRYRFSTLLMYLNNATSPKAGGGTGFPKAYKGRGLKVRPPRGSAVLFYSMLEDGNCDHYSEHTGLHVLEGEKWVSNLWVWDPLRMGVTG
ncbi:hypothetical protein AAMO2058_001118300 [Amorphochlora amoebiformis]